MMMTAEQTRLEIGTIMFTGACGHTRCLRAEVCGSRERRTAAYWPDQQSAYEDPPSHWGRGVIGAEPPGFDCLFAEGRQALRTGAHAPGGVQTSRRRLALGHGRGAAPRLPGSTA